MVQAPPKPKWAHGNGFDLRLSDGGSRECKGGDDCKDPREKWSEPDPPLACGRCGYPDLRMIDNPRVYVCRSCGEICE